MSAARFPDKDDYWLTEDDVLLDGDPNKFVFDQENYVKAVQEYCCKHCAMKALRHKKT